MQQLAHKNPWKTGFERRLVLGTIEGHEEAQIKPAVNKVRSSTKHSLFPKGSAQ
jgi:hypothetical protein